MPNFWPKSHALSSALNKRIVFIALKSCIKEVDDKKKQRATFYCRLIIKNILLVNKIY